MSTSPYFVFAVVHMPGRGAGSVRAVFTDSDDAKARATVTGDVVVGWPILADHRPHDDRFPTTQES